MSKEELRQSILVYCALNGWEDLDELPVTCNVRSDYRIWWGDADLFYVKIRISSDFGLSSEDTDKILIWHILEGNLKGSVTTITKEDTIPHSVYYRLRDSATAFLKSDL